ncbi:hypothetical protein Emed_005192 [Eimeria media]
MAGSARERHTEKTAANERTAAPQQQEQQQQRQQQQQRLQRVLLSLCRIQQRASLSQTFATRRPENKRVCQEAPSEVSFFYQGTRLLETAALLKAEIDISRFRVKRLRRQQGLLLMNSTHSPYRCLSGGPCDGPEGGPLAMNKGA